MTNTFVCLFLLCVLVVGKKVPLNCDVGQTKILALQIQHQHIKLYHSIQKQTGMMGKVVFQTECSENGCKPCYGNCHVCSKNKEKQTNETLQCEKGWEKFQDHCYLFSTNSTNWFQAELDCRTQDAFLAKVSSQEENNWLKQRARTLGKNLVGFWLGGTCNADKKTFRWVVDGSLPTIIDFPKGEPSSPGRELCLHLFRSFDFRWNDESCLTKCGYVCKR